MTRVRNSRKNVYCVVGLKKLTAILLLFLFLFHLVGYRGWFYLLEQQWQKEVELAFDVNDYNEADLITIRAPLMLPYMTDTRDFKRTDGQMTVNGKIYRYVKSKIENGEYVLLCLPDNYQDQLEKAKQDFASDANDFSVNEGHKKASNAKPPFLKLQTDSDQHFFNLDISQLADVSEDFKNIIAPKLPSDPHLSPEQPPDTLTA